MNHKIKAKLPQKQYAALYAQYLIKEADYQLITVALKVKELHPAMECLIVTEESRKKNDGKLFMKIPEICDIEGLDCINLVELLQKLGVKGRFQSDGK